MSQPNQHHNYTNPAFCQQSEYYPVSFRHRRSSSSSSLTAKVHRSESARSVQPTRTIHQQQQQQLQQQNTLQQSPLRNKSAGLPPPRPGPKPQVNLNARYASATTKSATTRNGVYDHIPERDQPEPSIEGYALVPLADIPCTDKGRYAFIPAREANQIRFTSARRVTKSQDDLDRFHERSASSSDMHDSSFTSLPPIPTAQTSTPTKISQNNASPSRMRSAFSTDFVANSRSLILVDQKSQQRYAIVPTAEDEELVDANQEIIQMHNGQAHRYAVIPTDVDDDDDDDDDDNNEMETCLSNGSADEHTNEKYATIKEVPLELRQKYSTQQHRNNEEPSPIITPSKNPVATQKLFEILSTPRKTPPHYNCQQTTPQQQQQQQQQQHHLQRKAYTTNSFTGSASSNRSNNHHRYHSQIISTSTPKSEFVPQKLQYEMEAKHHNHAQKPTQNIRKAIAAAAAATAAAQCEQQRSMAVITPRLAQEQQQISDHLELSMDKTWPPSNNNSRMTQATATIGAVSLMLMLAGAMNSGLCLYMISVFGRLYYLDLGIVCGFAAASLGLLGFKSRHCEWLPNRNYISGYILVTVFSLFNCAGLLVLLAMRPMPGSALHDVTTGVILGLSSLTLLVISLGVITSRWCRAPPPDNRVDVYNY